MKKLFWKGIDKGLGRVATFLAAVWMDEVIDVSRVKVLMLQFMQHSV